MLYFTLYSRSYCHLCQDMLDQLHTCLAEQPFQIDVIDIDEDAALLARFDELVPVLFGSRDGIAATQICHYFLDQQKLQEFLYATT
jgi:hypothetical protein